MGARAGHSQGQKDGPSRLARESRQTTLAQFQTDKQTDRQTGRDRKGAPHKQKSHSCTKIQSIPTRAPLESIKSHAPKIKPEILFHSGW